MQLVVTNVTNSPVLVRDLYTTIAPGSSVTTERSASELAAMEGLIEAVAANQVTVAITPTAEEIASGMLAPPSSVQAQDMAPVAASAVASGMVLLRQALVAGASPGNPDDVQVYAVNGLPFKFRVVDAWALISTAIGASELNVYTRAAGAGTLLSGPISSAATGRAQTSGPDTSAVAVPGATEGLFIRRDDQAVEGEVFILGRIES